MAGRGLGGFNMVAASASLLVVVVLLCQELMLLRPLMTRANAAGLDVGYYDESCPRVEDIVRGVVQDAVSQHAGLGPGLLRLHFHDCFVQGCDASILLDPNSNSSNVVEKDHPANAQSLRGMDVVDFIKDRLEQECKQTVSCADILAFAARDAVNIMGGPSWPVPAGRLDGCVSSAKEAEANLVFPTFDLQQLTQSFATKGLSQEDMITLSGAHTIGDSHCGTSQYHLYGVNTSHPQDPKIEASLATSMQSRCQGKGKQEVVGMDAISPRKFDVSYYAQLQKGQGLFLSDAALLSSPSTARVVSKHAGDEAFWFDSFADAMFRMSQIDVKTASNEGEIRLNCHVTNDY